MAEKRQIEEVELVKFQGDDLPAYRETVDGKEIVRVNVRAVCKAVGLELTHQLKRIGENPILAGGLVRVVNDTEAGARESDFLDLECVPLWLAGINLSRVKGPTREKLIAYQREVKTVLYEYFLGKGFAINEDRANMSLLLEETQQLKQKRLELALGILPFLERNPHVDKRYIARVAQLTMDETLGLREAAPQEVSLMDFLGHKGLNIKDASDPKLTSYGKLVAATFRRARDREPLKQSKILKTGEFMVNYYTTEDIDVLEEAFRLWNPKSFQA